MWSSRQRVAHDPRAPRSFGRQLALELVIVQDLVAFEVQRQHLPWSEATLLDDAVVVELDRPDLRACDHQAFGGDLVAAWPQAVPTVRKGEAGWPVPGLDDRGVVAIEVLDRRRHAAVAFPGGRHEHAQRVQHVASGPLEQMQGLVEAGRV